jgi:hypothetical protein
MWVIANVGEQAMMALQAHRYAKVCIEPAMGSDVHICHA